MRNSSSGRKARRGFVRVMAESLRGDYLRKAPTGAANQVPFLQRKFGVSESS